MGFSLIKEQQAMPDTGRLKRNVHSGGDDYPPGGI